MLSDSIPTLAGFIYIYIYIYLINFFKTKNCELHTKLFQVLRCSNLNTMVMVVVVGHHVSVQWSQAVLSLYAVC